MPVKLEMLKLQKHTRTVGSFINNYRWNVCSIFPRCIRFDHFLHNRFYFKIYLLIRNITTCEQSLAKLLACNIFHLANCSSNCVYLLSPCIQVESNFFAWSRCIVVVSCVNNLSKFCMIRYVIIFVGLFYIHHFEDD